VRPEDTVVITTAAYRKGQEAAWAAFRLDPDSQPNRALLARLISEEFAAGYCAEYNDFIVPARNRMPEPPCPSGDLHDAMPCPDCSFLGE
jgi:hypothetical protein